jgi:hypothetical protein
MSESRRWLRATVPLFAALRAASPLPPSPASSQLPLVPPQLLEYTSLIPDYHRVYYKKWVGSQYRNLVSLYEKVSLDVTKARIGSAGFDQFEIAR